MVHLPTNLSPTPTPHSFLQFVLELRSLSIWNRRCLAKVILLSDGDSLLWSTSSSYKCTHLMWTCNDRRVELTSLTYQSNNLTTAPNANKCLKSIWFFSKPKSFTVSNLVALLSHPVEPVRADDSLSAEDFQSHLSLCKQTTWNYQSRLNLVRKRVAQRNNFIAGKIMTNFRRKINCNFGLVENITGAIILTSVSS